MSRAPAVHDHHATPSTHRSGVGAARVGIVARIKPPAVAWLCLAAGIGLHFLLPEMRLLGWPARFIGLPVALLGVGLMLWAVGHFERSGAPHSTQANPTTLVAGGPLRFSRNPMYLGMTGFLLGAAVFLGTAPAFIAPLAFWLVIRLVFVPYEEAILEETLGEPYLEYKKRVRRWL
jgi:protein-S-isoprenylcysteine O-methyltransferase Ste14